MLKLIMEKYDTTYVNLYVHEVLHIALFVIYIGVRCLQCHWCQASDCENCSNCKDKKKYGGPDKKIKSMC